VDISDVLERKLQALACFRNELKQPPHPRSLRAIEALARGSWQHGRSYGSGSIHAGS
jgi:hypothetical protein